jgi:hypothetical protein
MKPTPYEGPLYIITRHGIELDRFRALVPLNFRQQLAVVIGYAVKHGAGISITGPRAPMPPERPRPEPEPLPEPPIRPRPELFAWGRSFRKRT